MFTQALLIASGVILFILTCYGLVYLAVIFRFLFIRIPAEDAEFVPKETGKSVTVLVASYNEGEALADTVETLLNQDFLGSIRVEILIAGSEDTSFAPIKNRFALDKGNSYTRGRHCLFVNFTGLKRKNDKINFALNGIDSDYVAFLDADHRAHPSWISSSVDLLEAHSADVVQAKRAPMDARKLFQFWDSAENHLGNEVFNHVFTRWQVSSFFTGTTCLFKANIFETQKFPESITEDTYLSYRLLCAGKKIIHNALYGLTGYREKTR